MTKERHFKVKLNYNRDNFKSNDTIIIKSDDDINATKLKLGAKHGIDNISFIEELDLNKIKKI